MKNNGLLKYIVAVLLFAFSFTLLVSAESVVDTTLEVGAEQYFASAVDYYGTVSCEGTKLTDVVTKTVKTAKGGTITFHPGGALSYSPPISAKLGDTDSFSCVYDIRDNEENVRYNYSVSVVKYEATIVEERRELTLDHPYYTLQLGSGLRVVTDGSNANGCPNPVDGITSSYFECIKCYDDKCEFHLKENTTIPEGGVEGRYDILYGGNGGLATGNDAVQKTIKLTLVGKMDKGVFAYGGAGQCNWNSQWEDPLEREMLENNTRGNTKMHKFTGVNDQVTLPSECTRDASSYPLPLKFEGWVLLQSAGPDRQAVNTCKNFGIVSNTVKYEAGKEQRYGSCYTMSGVMVYSSEVTIDDGNWADTGLGYHVNKTLNPTLPNATPRIISLNPSAEFIGYSTRNGDCNGKLLQPGEAATVGGAYYACVRADTTDADEQELNIKLNDKQDYIPGAGRVRGCTSENTEYVLADYSNGACVITGIKRTYQYRTPEDETDDYIIVKVLTDRSGTQLTLKIHVLGDDDMPTIDLDDYTLDSSSGAQLDDDAYGDRGDVISGTCGVYSLRPNLATRQESGIVVGQVSQTGDTAAAVLRVHFYQGISKCGASASSFVGICMDPGREEPDAGGSNYIKERDLDPKNNKFDRLISYIYTDTNFIKDVNSYQADGPNSGLKYLVSATVAIRLGAIIYEEDSNNLGMGLDGYYVAYKTVADNIKAQTGGDYSKTTASMLSTGAVQFNEPYASIAADFIAKGASYEGGWGELKTTVTDTTTEWNEAKTEYTKTIKGTLSGLNLFTKAALTLNSNCTGVFAGKCKLYIKNLETQDFDAYADGINYFQNATYVDRNGNLYYKYVIGPVSVSQVAKAVKDYKASGGSYGGGNGASAEGGNGGGGAGGPFDSVLTANYASPDAKGNVVKTVAKGGVNIQSMILYADASGDEGIESSCPDGYVYWPSDKMCHKTPTADGSEQGGGDGDPEMVEPQPQTEGGDWSVELGAEIDSDGQPIRLSWIHEYYQIGTLLPACDISKDIFNYKAQGPSFDKDLFKMAGCCSFVFDHSSEFYKSTCSEMCIYNSVTPVCTFNESSDKDYDVTKIVEAREGDSDNYSCIISANESAPYTTTKNKKDPAGNKYMLEEFEGNFYCRVSCKEDWQFNFPSLKNYVGANAVRAGSFFIVKDKNVFVGGTRTCVSTKIQHGAYEGNVLSTAPVSVDNFDLWQTHGAILDAYDQAEYDSLGTYEYCDGEMEQDTGKRCGGTTAGSSCSTDADCDEGVTCANTNLGTYHCDGTKKTCADWHVNPNVPIEFKYAVMPNTDDVTLDTVGWGPVDGSHGFQPFAQDIVMGHKMDGSEPGDCLVDKEGGPDKEDAKAKLYEELGILGWSHDDGKGAMQAANAALARYAANIAACDNWQLYTKHTKSAGTIYTVFEPSITFEYDETEYMKEIGSNNILTRNEALNEKCTSVDEANGCPEVARKSYKTGTFYKCNGGSIDPVTYTGCTEIAIAYDGNGNETNGTRTGPTHLVCAAGGDGFSIVGASKESSGHVTEWHTDDGCFYVTFSHLDADYIKRSISEGSYYKSPYTWYINKITDVKIYARTLAEYARIKPTSGADKLSQWSPLGTSQVEESVFPVMVKTPRNMYKYKYKLTQVGMYANSSDVGRIMGGPTAIFSNNNRICFYEVVELICKCCADRVDTHVKVGSLEGYSNDGTDNRKINTAEALTISGYDYQVSNFSSPTVGSEGRLGYLTSTVSLGDIMSNRGRDETSTIWSDQSIYMVSGVDQVTAQGAMLKGYIEDNANKIYDATPEYSYTLTPSAMSGIRRYNEAYGFQPNVNTLKAYGYIKYQNATQTGWLGKMYSKGDNVSDVHFTHYGSRFLEENAAPYITKDYKDAVLTNKSDFCYMVIEKSASAQEDNPDYKGASTKLYKGYDGQAANYKDCRWIDVVQKTTNSSNTGTVEAYSRLAFK